MRKFSFVEDVLAVHRSEAIDIAVSQTKKKAFYFLIRQSLAICAVFMQLRCPPNNIHQIPKVWLRQDPQDGDVIRSHLVLFINYPCLCDCCRICILKNCFIQKACHGAVVNRRADVVVAVVNRIQQMKLWG